MFLQFVILRKSLSLIFPQNLIEKYRHLTSHAAYVATETELYGAKIDGLLPPNFL